MSYKLYLGTKFSWDELKNVVINVFNENVIRGMQIYKNADKFSIGCDWFTLYISDSSEGIGFASEDYALDLKYQFWFDLLSSVEGSTEMMLNVIGRILEQISGDAILMWNGELPIMERRNGIITVDDKMSDPQGPPYPFEQMNVQYQKGYLKL